MSQNSVCIVTHAYLQPDGNSPQIGGVQTYVDGLLRALTPLALRLDVLQPAERDFEKRLADGARVIGVGGGLRQLKRAYQRHYRGKYTLTIFTTLLWARWSDGERSLAVQHGVYWDGFQPRYRGPVAGLYKAYKAFEVWDYRRQVVPAMEKASAVICVDLNFPNWLRAAFPFRRWDEKLVYVPNFGDPISADELAAKQRRPGEDVRVLIARRFEPNRGFPLIAEIVAEIAGRYPQCRFLFAGRGSREGQLCAILAGLDNCEVRAVPYDQMRRICWESDVAVVPTVFSEGTSLACIEAMCAGSAVLVTGVGGLGNLVLDNYNGLLVEPTRNALAGGLVRLLEDGDLRRRLGRNGYETASACFSRGAWEAKIRRLVEGYLSPANAPARRPPVRQRPAPAGAYPAAAMAAWNQD